jgi:hypothetical protein
MRKNKKGGILANIVVPILLGSVIYYLFSPDVLFVKSIDSITGLDFHITIYEKNNFVFEFIRNYFLDMLWAYALVITLFYLIGNNTASLLKIFLIAFSFSVAMEILQVTSIAKGTFDRCDIVVEFLAEVAAVFIIKKYFLEEKKE